MSAPFFTETPGIDDSGQFEYISGSTPPAVASSSVLLIWTNFSCFCHQKIQLSLWQLIELLEFQLTAKKVTAKPFSMQLLVGNVMFHSAWSAPSSLPLWQAFEGAVLRTLLLVFPARGCFSHDVCKRWGLSPAIHHKWSESYNFFLLTSRPQQITCPQMYKFWN